MAVPTKREERLLNLVTLLLSGRTPSLRDVLQEVPGYSPEPETGRSEFNRDKRQLASEGFPVETVDLSVQAGEQRFGYRILPDRYELPDFGLTDDEAAAIRRALSSVDLSGDADTFALWKLGGADPLVESPIGGLATPPELAELLSAIDDAAVVTFLYRGRAHEVEPHGLLMRRAHWYLSGRSRLDGTRRTYRVDRIDAGSLGRGEAGAFEPPAQWDPEVVMPSEPWTMGGEDPVQVQVAVVGPLARWVEASLRTASVVGELEGGIVVEMAVSHRESFRSWLLSLGSDGEVLSPPDVRADVVAWLEGVIAGHALDIEARPMTAEAPPVRTAPALRWLRRTMAMLAWLDAQAEPVAVADVARRFAVARKEVVEDLLLAACCGVAPFEPADLYEVELSDDESEVRLHSTPWLHPRRAMLTPAEVVAVSTSGQLLAQLVGPEERDVLTSAVAKVSAAMGVSGHLRVVLDSPPHLGALRAAVRSKIQVRIDYFAATTHRISEDRLVDPLRVFMDQGRWYLEAWDHGSARRRRFRVDRILELEPLETPVKSRYPKAVPEQWPPVEAPVVVLRAPATASWVAEAHPAEVRQRDDGSVELEMRVADWQWLANLLLQIGPGVEVVEPAERRSLPSDAARAVLQRYRD
ncbi:MAG: transcriptional regulator [Acidimicrobiia bacterium]|nr:transcriptional regulator [Acidimicrobiia bacterium]